MLTCPSTLIAEKDDSSRQQTSHRRMAICRLLLFATSDLVTVASLDESINIDATQLASGPAGGETRGVASGSTVHNRSQEGAGRSSTQHMEGGSSEPMSGEDQDDDPSHADEPSSAITYCASLAVLTC